MCEKIKAEMRLRHIKQYQMAEVLGMPLSTFNSKLNRRYRNGTLSREHIKIIAAELLIPESKLTNLLHTA